MIERPTTTNQPTNALILSSFYLISFHFPLYCSNEFIEASGQFFSSYVEAVSKQYHHQYCAGVLRFCVILQELTDKPAHTTTTTTMAIIIEWNSRSLIVNKNKTTTTFATIGLMDN
ncbi:hypothetical protein DERF_000643 [Dermatophagoides farinae]|uniref:Uncharacterized protein n=1 Tax=Dermatophagoides farinae TaxID=6954 RepID=A0A922L8V0_DERFA|nr:hypothetical protein DERF_000643 [Dermatophagoides farinae]